MRVLKALIALLFAVAGLLIGALNRQTVDIDLFFTRIQAHLGLVLLLCVLAGAVVGGALASVGLLLNRRAENAPKRGAADGADAP